MVRRLGIDDFFSFIRALFAGEWRISVYIARGEPVIDLIGEAILKMIGMITIPLVVGIGLGIFLGKISSKNRGTWKDKAIQFFSIFGISLSVIFFGLLLKYFLCEELGFCEPMGISAVPIGILTISFSALISWQTRSYMIKEPRNKSVVSNTIMIGIIFGFIFLFYMLIEYTFYIAGFSNLLLVSLILYDYFLLAGCLFALLIMFVILILISNLLFSFYMHKKSEYPERELEPILARPKTIKRELLKKENHGKKILTWIFSNLKFLFLPGSRIEELSLREFEYEKKIGKRSIARRLKNPLTILGYSVLFFVITLAVFAEWLSPQVFDEAMLPHAGSWNPPSSEYPLGQTVMGGDVLSKTIWGIRNALLFGFSTILVGLVGGGILGYLAVIFNNWGERIINGLMIFFYIIPGIILCLLYIGVYGPFTEFALPIIGILLIPNFTRAIASTIPRKINVKHITKTIISQIPLNLAIAIILYTSTEFLGFFMNVDIRLGDDIGLAFLNLSEAPWASLWPGFALFGLIFGLFAVHADLQGYELPLRELENVELK
ncbi:MAG: hypothetical protein KGD58_05470 [Candidatus Lokiarchaeota archaeon]|nr:hypothetical protein [Candidatus Lokiarchaeota archaeon]